MSELRPVTDPDILRQLNSGSDIPVPAPPGMKPVTDPAILAQLNSGEQTQQKQTLWDKLGTIWPARMAKDAYSAFTLPGDVNAGRVQVDPSNPEFMHRVTTLGSMAPVGVLPSVTSAAPSAQRLISTGGQQVKQAEESGLMFDPASVQEGIQTIRQSLPKRRNAEDTHAQLDDLAKKAESGQPVTIGDIKETRDDLLAAQANAAKSTSRTAATDLRASTIAKHGIDDLYRGTSEGDLLIEGNANITGGKFGETLNRKQYISEVRASTANSGKNLENTIRRNIGNMLISGETRGMGPEAQAAAEKVAFGTKPENFMRHWGNVLGGGGGLGQILTAGTMGGLGYLGSGGNPTVAGIAAVALPAIGHALKSGATTAAINHLEALSQMLRAQTPLGKIETRGNYLAGVPEGIPAAKAALIRSLLSQGAQNPPQQ